jgi:hypothetical protein
MSRNLFNIYIGQVCGEKHRFETLVDYFVNYDSFYVEFMVAAMQFINIIVHSVDDMNERVYLQYEFMQLGIDTYLDKLRNTQSEELRVSNQICIILAIE